MIETEKRKVVLVGTGMVGMSYAYAMLNQNTCDELVLIDLDEKRAWGEALDLNHGMAFAPAHMRVAAGSYNDCGDADIVALCAGVARRPGENRPDLLARNAQVFRTIIEPVMRAGFKGIFLVATNPVDTMTHITSALSGLPSGRVVGAGTSLDTARLRFMLGDYFGVDPRNVHAYVMGEHGDSEFVPWSQAMVASTPVLALCEESGGRWCREDLEKIEDEVRTVAKKVIEAKHATYYGIGMAMARITRAVFGGENSILTVTADLGGAYGESGVWAGAPCVVGRTGVRQVMRLQLTAEEQQKLHASCEILRGMYSEAGISSGIV